MIKIDEDKIQKALDKLYIKAAPGPDGITPSCLKYDGKRMFSFITLILRKSFSQGNIPLNHKTAGISPVFKGGDRSLTENYRPVDLASHLSKVFERVVRLQIMDYLKTRGMLDS